MIKYVLLLFVTTLSSILATGSYCFAQRKSPDPPKPELVTPGPARVSDTLLPTGQRLTPAGKLLSLPGRPNDLALGSDGRRVFVKSHKTLQCVDTDTMQLQVELPIEGGASLTGILVSDQGRVFVTNSKNQLHCYGESASDEDPEDTFQLLQSYDLPADSFPCGLCFGADQSTLYICLSKKNSVVQLDLDSGTVTQTFDVGISPFEVVFDAARNSLWVSNLGGRRAEADEQTATSAGTDTPVDERGIAKTGSVSRIDLDTLKVAQNIEVGLHPMCFQPNDNQLLLTLANADSIAVIENDAVALTTVAKPEMELSFGSMPTAICRSPDHKYLFVALSGNNAVAVYAGEEAWSDSTQPIGFIPTAWFPSGLACDDQFLYVANLKGSGSRAPVRPASKGFNSHDHLGSIQQIPLADLSTDSLARWTAEVKQQARVLPNRLAEFSPEDAPQPVPVPDQLGAPSVFKHVVYVIKENRTYDQVFGDIAKGRGEPGLCVFPEKNTPNHHALARRFGLLDNYYCNGVLSADGHSWATEGNVMPYLERAFGGFSRSYTFGDDPLTYSSSGFLWDHVLGAGLSFRNYGEMDYAKPPAGMDYQKIWQAFEAGDEIQFQQNIGIDRLRRYSCPDYPGWGMMIPDVLRMKRFLKEFRQFEANGDLPNLSVVYLPQDHLGGGVTSAAHMADNDLALGQLVEAVSGSRFWKDTLIVVNEDDPQNGYDHIDGHRSLCLVISAYSKTGVNHHFYNQTSVLRTILHVLGLPPMNQQEARSPLMTDCFSNEPDFRPYKALDANFALNQAPQPAAKQSQVERHWRSILATVPIERTGMKTPQDEDNLNRFIWHESKGWDTAYPVQWVGNHGRGLKELGLEFSDEAGDDD